MSNDHTDKRYLVIGASSGIGAEIARRLAQEGATLTLMARRTEMLEEVKSELAGQGHIASAFDVDQLDAINSKLESLLAGGEVWNGMVYAAGNINTMRLRDLTPERLLQSMRVNFCSFVEFVRGIMGHKPKQKYFRIVAISSLAATCSDKYFTPYAASKAAMDAAVRCLSRELASKNTTINSIRPGVVDVERLRTMEDLTGGLDRVIRENGFQPLGLIPPADIADMTSWLLSDSASRISGVSLPFNGGAAC